VSPVMEIDVTETIQTMAKAARRAALRLARGSADERRQALLAIADAVDAASEQIVAANATDLAAADEAGITGAMRDRLVLDAGHADALRHAGRRGREGQREHDLGLHGDRAQEVALGRRSQRAEQRLRRQGAGGQHDGVGGELAPAARTRSTL